MPNNNRKQAEKLIALALELEGENKIKEAIEVYNKAIKTDPTWPVSYYNLGLIYKYRHDWENSLLYNKKSAEIYRTDPPSWWNLGIAATALKDWKTARLAWSHFGVKVPGENDTDEIRMNIGMTPIRLSENREVVWATRIDPARAIIENVPTGPSNRRYKDLILNDGAPMGTRTVDGREFPVFEELQLLQASEYQTFSVWVRIDEEKYLENLEQKCETSKMGFENWTNTIRYICRQCSEGKPHEIHDKDLVREIEDGHYNLGLAATSEKGLSKLLTDWQKKCDAEVMEMERVI